RRALLRDQAGDKGALHGARGLLCGGASLGVVAGAAVAGGGVLGVGLRLGGVIPIGVVGGRHRGIVRATGVRRRPALRCGGGRARDRGAPDRGVLRCLGLLRRLLGLLGGLGIVRDVVRGVLGGALRILVLLGGFVVLGGGDVLGSVRGGGERGGGLGRERPVHGGRRGLVVRGGDVRALGGIAGPVGESAGGGEGESGQGE